MVIGGAPTSGRLAPEMLLMRSNHKKEKVINTSPISFFLFLRA